MTDGPGIARTGQRIVEKPENRRLARVVHGSLSWRV